MKKNSNVGSTSRIKKTQISSILLVFGSFLILATWAVSSPTGSSPDDNYHLPSIWCSDLGNPRECEKKNEQYFVPNQIADRNMICYIIWIDRDVSAYKKNASCIYDKVNGFSEVSYLNQTQKQYPNIGYSISSLLVSENIDESVLRIRIFWSCIFLLLVLWSMLEIGRKSAINSLPILILMLFPLGIFLIPSTNPSSLSIISLTCLPFALIAFLDTKVFGLLFMRRLILLMIITFLGAGSRSDAAFYLIIVSTILLFLKRKNQIMIVKIIVILPSLLFSFTNFITSRQTNFALKSGLGQSNSGFDSKSELDFHNLINFPKFIIGFWGYDWGLGWKFEPPITNVMSLLFFLNFVALYFVIGLKMLDMTSKIVLIGFILIVAGISLYTMHVSGAVVGQIIQPRYLYPLFISGVISTLLISKSKKKDEFSGNMQIYIFISVAISLIFSSLVLRSMIMRLVNGLSSGGMDLRPDSWWWPSFWLSPTSIFQLNLAGIMIFLVGFRLQQSNLKKGLYAERD